MEERDKMSLLGAGGGSRLPLENLDRSCQLPFPRLPGNKWLRLPSGCDRTAPDCWAFYSAVSEKLDKSVRKIYSLPVWEKGSRSSCPNPGPLGDSFYSAHDNHRPNGAQSRGGSGLRIHTPWGACPLIGITRDLCDL